MTDAATLLDDLLSGNEVSNASHLVLKERLKPIFFYQAGFMSWLREKEKGALKQKIVAEGEALLRRDANSCDELIEAYASMASELNQGVQQTLFYTIVEMFPKFPGSKLSSSAHVLLERLKAGLASSNSAERDRAVMLITQYAVRSDSQSNKSVAGTAAEQAVELLFRSLEFKKQIHYGTQFIHKGSNTDFVVPYAKHREAHKIHAYIAVQVSTNDRARLSSSELHQGAKRYLCSLNGCSASSKSTKDIGNDLAAGYLENETYYVVIEKERIRAIEDAKQRLANAREDEKVNIEKRVRWLTAYSLNFDKFAKELEEILSLAGLQVDQFPKEGELFDALV